MLLARYGTFSGGIDLPEEKHATLDSPIAPCPRLRRLWVPLCLSPEECEAQSPRPLVEAGKHVSIGQQIGAGGADGVDVFAPVPGIVAALGTVAVAGPDALHTVPAIAIDAAGTPGGLMPLAPATDWRAAEPAELRRRIEQSGIVVHRRPMVPLRRWMHRALDSRRRLLVANAVEMEPYVTADHRLLVEHGPEVVRGLAILARAVEARQTVLAVSQARTDDYRGLVGPSRMYEITRVALPRKYPVGADPVLLKILTRREMPPRGSPGDVGAAVIDAATCFAIYRYVACGVRATARVVTVAGERAARPGNYWTPFGAACSELVDGPQDLLVHGGPMAGLRCVGACAVAPGTDALLAMDSPRLEPPGPCVRCGWCTDHCPARLNVAAMNDAFELSAPHRAGRMGVNACIECGVCSYVCPARLPLSQRVKALKHAASGLRTGRAEGSA